MAILDFGYLQIHSNCHQHEKRIRSLFRFVVLFLDVFSCLYLSSTFPSPAKNVRSQINANKNMWQCVYIDVI